MQTYNPTTINNILPRQLIEKKMIVYKVFFKLSISLTHIVDATKGRQIWHFKFQKYEETCTPVDMLIYKTQIRSQTKSTCFIAKREHKQRKLITHCDLHVHPLVEAAI